ncbi:hypothetical protein ACE1B6_09500 [Aerosakkonemataceae cyanobacterium BLCC-F154]|uniref:Ribosomal protein L22 n=1 Tax=Floridaenema fluviatile BLCC-F154 TaxID=3153640 RepID=A0ABV4YBK0_9CYAN
MSRFCLARNINVIADKLKKLLLAVKSGTRMAITDAIKTLADAETHFHFRRRNTCHGLV